MSINLGPVGAPFLGPEPGFTSPNTLYPFILATVLVCGISTTLFAAARLITKRLISAYDIEDYFLMLAWVVCLGYSILMLVAGLDGLGHHVRDITAAELPGIPRLLQFSWALEIIYIPAIWLAKSSLLFQLIHIFTPMKSGPVYWACHALIWGNLAFYLCILFMIVFECHPIDEVWNLFYRGHCINRNTVLVASGGVNVFSDLLNLLLPIWATWHLQMAPKRKAGIITVFATGVLAFVSSICRLLYATRMETTAADVSFIVVQIGLWALAEVASIILCTCFPMMPRLVKLISDRKAKPGSPSYSNSPVRRAWKRKLIHVGADDSSSGEDGAGLLAAEERSRRERLHQQWGGVDTVTSDDSRRDVELAMPIFDVQDFRDFLERRLNLDFSVPRFSYF